MKNYTGYFNVLKHHCLAGASADIDAVMAELDNNTDLPTTRAIDFFLSLVDSEEGIKRIEYYLFNGSQIQRNYCTLLFARRNEWKLVNRAYEMGLVDKTQAYSR